MVSTVGVVGTTSSEALGTSLYYHRMDPAVPEVVQEALRNLEGTWTRPDGELFSDILSLHRARRQLAMGFYYRWVWPNGAPTEDEQAWINARKAWHSKVRDQLAGLARPGMDSPWFLAAAAERGLAHAEGRLPASQQHLPRWLDHGSPVAEWVEWKRYRHMPAPPREAVWLDSFAVEAAAAWSKEHPEGIIWTQHEALGQAVSLVANIPYFGGGEQASKGIKDLQDQLVAQERHQCVVASLSAHGTAKNLQHAWSKMLYLEVPANGTTMEQSVGREHRTGQRADEVHVWIALHTQPLEEALCAAMLQASYIEETLGQRQKLIYGTKSFRLQPSKFDKKLLDALWREEA